ncbi:MAG: EF-hand domain-containing protein [Reichenbachiella sp.]|uniref:EF-hand domain-containing protein n=1 Tax=Reichenbachiella sp. TaxID=2184521 RepID=UPI003298E059
MKVLMLKMSAVALAVLISFQIQAKQDRPDKEEIFAKLDVSKDGQLDKNEFKSGGKKLREEKKDSRDPRKAFDKMDSDKSGAIEFDEFEKMSNARSERPAPPSPDELFEKMDVDNDGFVSLEEFKAHKGPERKGKN